MGEDHREDNATPAEDKEQGERESASTGTESLMSFVHVKLC